MRMQPEAQFKRRLVTSFGKHVPGGWYTYIVKGPGMKDGMPDLLFGCPGRRVLWLEAKGGVGRLRPAQKKTFDALLQPGHPWWVGEGLVVVRSHGCGLVFDPYPHDKGTGNLKVWTFPEFWSAFFLGPRRDP